MFVYLCVCLCCCCCCCCCCFCCCCFVFRFCAAASALLLLLLLLLLPLLLLLLLLQLVETLVRDGWGPCLLTRLVECISAALRLRVKQTAAAIKNLLLSPPAGLEGGPQGAPNNSYTPQKVLNEGLELFDYYRKTTVGSGFRV